MEDGFYRSKDPTNSIKVLKEAVFSSNSKSAQNFDMTVVASQFL